MRHIVLGMDSVLGSSLLRILVSLTDQQIIACGENILMPEGLPPNRIRSIAINPDNPLEIAELLYTDDVVYFVDISLDEDSRDKKLGNRYQNYLSNVLHYANEREVSKVVCFIPQSFGWNIPLNSSEETEHTGATIYHEAIRQLYNFCKVYWSGKQYYDATELDTDINVQSISDEDLLKTLEMEFGSDKTDISFDAEPEVEAEIKIETEADTQIKSETETRPPLASNLEDNDDEPILDVVLQEDTKNNNHVPLLIARIARFFGPFEEYITEKFCFGVRLRRLLLNGKAVQTISWIHPIDAARSMVLLADQDLPNDEFLINGFNASGTEIVVALDRANGSKTIVKSKSYTFQLLKLKLKGLLKKLGVVNRVDYASLFRMNKPQLFTDEKAIQTWKWKPRYNLDETAADAMDWFINHALTNRKNSN